MSTAARTWADGAVRLRFETGQGTEGPTTWGQHKTFLRRRSFPHDRYSSFLVHVAEAPPGTSVDDVASTVEWLLVTHESLRTVYPSDDGTRQRVVGSGEFRITVRDADAAGLERELTTDPFDLERELPIRVAIATVNGEPREIVLVFSHIAIDGVALGLVSAQFEEALRSPVEPPPYVRPLDLAYAQRSQAWVKRNDRAVRYWTKTISNSPQCMLALPAGRGGPSRYITGRMRSSAAADALPVLVRRTHTSASTVMLAAVGAVLAATADNTLCVITSIAANRSEPGTRDYVGTIAQDALILLDTGQGSFDEVTRRAWRAAVDAYRHSQFHPVELADAIGRIAADRGGGFARDCVYNDRSTSVTSRFDASSGTVVTVEPATFMPVRFFFMVHRTAGVTELSLWADTRYLPESGVTAFLYAVERLLVLAAETDLPLARLRQTVGIEPLPRGPTWARVGPSWIDLHSTRRLVERSAPGCSAEITVDDGQLVARLTGGPPTDPRRLRADCLALLPGFDGAAAPSRIVTGGGR